MAMPESPPRRPGKPGQNRDSRDGVFGHPESQVGPLPRVGLYARVSTPHQHTIGMQLRQLREFLKRRRWQEVLVVEEVASGSRRRPERDRLLSGPAASLRVIFHTVAAQAPISNNSGSQRLKIAVLGRKHSGMFWRWHSPCPMRLANHK